LSKKLFFVSLQLGQIPLKSFSNLLCFDLKKINIKDITIIKVKNRKRRVCIR
jgi:hypothetical protein